MTSPSPAGRHRLAGLLLPLVLGLLTVGFAMAMTMPFLSLFLSTEVEAGPGQVTLFLVLAPLSGVVASTVMGRLSDSGSTRRRLMVVAAVTGVVGCSVNAVVRNYWVLLVLAVTAIALAGTVFPQTLAYARQRLTRELPERAALGISTLRTSVSVAWVGGPPLAAFLIEAGGFRLVYALAAVLYAAAALVILLRLDEVPAPSPTAAAGDAELPSPSRWALWATAAAFVLLQAPLTLAAQAMPFFTTRELGGDVGDAGLVMGVCAALEIPLMMGLGILSTRVPLRPMVLAGSACGVLYFAITAAVDGLGLLLAVQVLNAVFIAAVAGLGISYVQDMLPESPGRATTLFTNTVPVGAMLAGPLFGVAQHVGIRLAYAMGSALCLAGLVILLVVPAGHAGRRTRRPAVRQGGRRPAARR